MIKLDIREIRNKERPKRRLKIGFYDDYYLRGSLDDRQIEYLEGIYAEGKVDKLKDVVVRSAKVFGRDCEDIELYDAQTLAVAASYINPYFFVGDKPGLGKTIIAAGAVAHTRLKYYEENQKDPNFPLLGKVLVVTDNNHVKGTEADFKRCGINLLPLYGGTQKIERTLKKVDFRNDDSIDGVVTSWESLRVNGFLMFYLDNQDLFEMGIMDETSVLKSTKTQVFKQADIIASNFSRCIFLNASPFETNIDDMFNQLKVLNPTIIPVKKFINENYVIYSRDSWFETERQGGGYKPVKKFAWRVSDYKNQEDLRERLRYHYISRSKEDYSDDLPSKMYKLHPVKMTERQSREIVGSGIGYKEILNSPTTRDPEARFDSVTVPKFGVAIDLFESIAHERPVIYCVNNKAQERLRDELRSKGYRVEIISGQCNNDPEDRQRVLDDFKSGYLDGLITNIQKALSIYGSKSMIFYDIETNPQITYQIMGRIDRNNYNEDRSYHFLMYLDSPEMYNMARLAAFREEHSNKFTGQSEDVYKQLIVQLETYLVEGGEEKINKRVGLGDAE